MAEVNPFALIQQGVENTNALFSGMQRSILQARQLQIQEQGQIFNQGIALEELKLKEKGQALDATVSMAKLGLAEREMNMQAALMGAKIGTEQAHARYYDAQSWKAQQMATAAPYSVIPLDGDADAIISSANGLEAQAAMTVDPVLQGVLTEMEQPPVAPAYQQDRSLTNTLGSTMAPGMATGIAVEDAAERGYDLFLDDAPQRQQQAPAAPQNTSSWQQLNKALDTARQQAMLMPKWTQGQREMRMQEIERTRLRLAQDQYASDPQAQQLLNSTSESVEYIRELAAKGDRVGVQGVQKQFQEQYGYDNPVYQKAAREGFDQYRRDEQRKQQDERYSSLLKLRMDAEAAGRDVTIIDKQINQIEATMGLSAGSVGDRSQVDAIMDAASSGNPFYSPNSTAR